MFTALMVDDGSLILSSGLQLLEEGTMSNAPRDWPNEARAMRDKSLDEAIAAKRELDRIYKLIEGDAVKDILWSIRDRLENIKDLMVKAGAPHRPIY